MFLRRLLSVFSVCAVVCDVTGHGRLVDPPARSTMWRYGWPTPADYQDNELFCGGFQTQWVNNDGRCGICGDPYDGAREHEMGGRYGKGVVSRQYKAGSVVEFTAQITANHKGWMEFRLCPTDSLSTPATQQCVDSNLLQLADGSGTRYKLPNDNIQKFVVRVKLPAGLKCKKCLLQWKYHAGNSWGTDRNSGHSCVGCGPQEEFYGCADIRIARRAKTILPPTTTTTTTTTSATSVAPSGDQRCTSGVYVPTAVYANAPDMESWCQLQCDAGYCPVTHCMCRT